MLKAFKKLWNDERGNMLVISGVALPLLVGAAGLATDTIQWAVWKRELQRAADSAAIAGVYDRVQAKGATTTAETAINRDLEVNYHLGFDMLDDYPEISYPADTTTDKKKVKVVLAVQRRLGFSGMFMTSAPPIRRQLPVFTTASRLAVQRPTPSPRSIATSNSTTMSASS
jgi:Flp pilus assembly protein TadG